MENNKRIILSNKNMYTGPVDLMFLTKLAIENITSLMGYHYHHWDPSHSLSSWQSLSRVGTSTNVQLMPDRQTLAAKQTCSGNCSKVKQKNKALVRTTRLIYGWPRNNLAQANLSHKQCSITIRIKKDSFSIDISQSKFKSKLKKKREVLAVRQRKL